MKSLWEAVKGLLTVVTLIKGLGEDIAQIKQKQEQILSEVDVIHETLLIVCEKYRNKS